MEVKSAQSLLQNKQLQDKDLKVFIEGIIYIRFRLDSALARQIFYTTTRLGIFKTITEKIK